MHECPDCGLHQGDVTECLTCANEEIFRLRAERTEQVIEKRVIEACARYIETQGTPADDMDLADLLRSGVWEPYLKNTQGGYTKT